MNQLILDFYFFTGCNCHGHSNACRYDKIVAAQKRSLDMHGNYTGGGVCLNCQVCFVCFICK